MGFSMHLGGFIAIVDENGPKMTDHAETAVEKLVNFAEYTKKATIF